MQGAKHWRGRMWERQILRNKYIKSAFEKMWNCQTRGKIHLTERDKKQGFGPSSLFALVEEWQRSTWNIRERNKKTLSLSKINLYQFQMDQPTRMCKSCFSVRPTITCGPPNQNNRALSSIRLEIIVMIMRILHGHTAWAPKGCERGSQAARRVRLP